MNKKKPGKLIAAESRSNGRRTLPENKRLEIKAAVLRINPGLSILWEPSDVGFGS